MNMQDIKIIGVILYNPTGKCVCYMVKRHSYRRVMGSRLEHLSLSSPLIGKEGERIMYNVMIVQLSGNSVFSC